MLNRLAEHPAGDAEPATIPWIDSEMPQLENSSSSPYQRRYEFCSGVRIIAEGCEGGFKTCEFWMGSGNKFRSRPATRRDVRLLLELLKEQA